MVLGTFPAERFCQHWIRPCEPRRRCGLNNDLYIGTLDCYLVALDLKSGAERWSTKVVDYKQGYSMTMAPLAIEGKIVVGVSGGEAGIRGFSGVAAYDAQTGQQAWRFYTIPGPGEPGHDTWSGDSWKTGGGPTWVTGAYDPDLKLVYWGVGNPGPDWNGDVRPGDNLYTCSLIALDADTGKLRWYFQFTPHDTHDWDSNHVPMLFDGNVDGQKRKLIAVANRNAFYYVLDRTNGQFITGRPYARETWAKGLDAKGRPIVNPGSDPTEAGAMIWPNLNGATDWPSPSYSPQTGLVYVPVHETRRWGSTSNETHPIRPDRCSREVGRMNYLGMKAGAKSRRSRPKRENSNGSLSCFPLRGREFFRRLADLCSQAQTKGTSMLWMLRQASLSGISRQALS